MFLRYYLTKEMHKQFGLYTVLNSRTFINSTRKNRLITPFFVFLICLPNWDTWGGFPGILILPGIVFLLFPLLSKSGAKGSISQISDDKPVDEVSGENQLYVQEWTLVEISPRSRLEIPYYNVRRLVVDGNMLYIYFSTEGAVVVPFSAFRDRGELEYLINFICYKHPSLHRPELPVQSAYGPA
ncbi:YcxB family protein [Deltaproteobacteria bacterium OttesenSCG-928-M10]|nr:YcxB family protein [Deltaproteobacteria bacterium OttesenSCG-928-M10]